MNLFEVNYKSEDGKERKVRVVASHATFAISEAYKRKYPGRKKEIISFEDQGVVFVAEPQKGLEELLLSRAILVGDVVEALDKDIAALEADERRHRENMKRITAMKERLSTPREI